MDGGDYNHGECAPVDGQSGLDKDWQCEVAVELAECFVHECLGPDVRAKQVSKELLNGGDEVLGIGQVVPSVRGKEWRDTSACAEP